MQERWRLIQSGVSRKSIRVRGDALYVSNKFHGRVSNSKFEHASIGPGTPRLSQPSSPRNTSPIVQHDQQSVLTSPDESTTSLVDNSCLQDPPPSGPDIRTALATPPAPNGCAPDTEF